MKILKTGTAQLLCAGDRAQAGIWRWTLSFIVICASLWGVVFAFGYIFEWFLGPEALDTVLWEGVSKTRDEALLTHSFYFLGIAFLIPAISLGLWVVNLRIRDVIAPSFETNWGLIAFVAVSMFVLITIVTFVGLWTYHGREAIHFDPLPVSYLHFAPIFLIAIIFQASAEELLLRGYLLQLLGRWTKNGWIILLVISGLFASLHFVNPEIDAFGSYAYFHYTCAALLFTSLALITGRLEYSIGTHIGWNWLIFLVDIDSPSAPDLYTGLGALVYVGDIQILPYDWVLAGLEHVVMFLICLVIHFEYVEPRQARSLR